MKQGGRRPKYTLGDGAGDVVNANIQIGGGDIITLGNGNHDTVIMHRGGGGSSGNNTITLGNGNGDVVNDYYTGQFSAANNTITVGNGNDTIHVGFGDTVTVGKGQDAFVFEQTTPGLIGAVAINHFDTGKDVITLSSQFKTTVSYHDNSQGNAVITVDTSGDTITLVGVHSAALHTSDFHFARASLIDDARGGNGLIIF